MLRLLSPLCIWKKETGNRALSSDSQGGEELSCRQIFWRLIFAPIAHLFPSSPAFSFSTLASALRFLTSPFMPPSSVVFHAAYLDKYLYNLASLFYLTNPPWQGRTLSLPSKGTAPQKGQAHCAARGTPGFLCTPLPGRSAWLPAPGVAFSRLHDWNSVLTRCSKSEVSKSTSLAPLN